MMIYLSAQLAPIRNRDGTSGSTFIAYTSVRAGADLSALGYFVAEQCVTYKATLQRGRVAFKKAKYGAPYRVNV